MAAVTRVPVLVSLYAVVAVLASAAFSTLASAQLLKTDGGLVEGVRENGIVVFKGIPFAAPPVGALRWRAPKPPVPWLGVKSADRFSPICMQRGSYPENAPPEPMSEDCLYLNVWVPTDTVSEKLPVMLWIHGGGLVNGSASTPLYAGDALARRNVIVVTANYRLGALGFLAHPALTRESEHKVSGNYGLLDQLAALGWVQRNIGAFGGDRGNVTVFGQSSGSISISALIASPLARGMFHRAIGQSGGLFEPLDVAPEFTLTGAERAGQGFVTRMGASSLQDLRGRLASEIIAKPFGANPIIDGYVLPESPYQAYVERRHNDVALLIGSNTGEGLSFLANRTVTATTMTSELGKDFPSFVVSLIGPKKPANDREALASFVAFQGDMRFGWNMWAWARLHARAGKHQVFLYQFSHVPPHASGASHGVEMSYVFDHLDLQSEPWTQYDRHLADVMSAYWTNFAKSGDPNGVALPSWPAFSSTHQDALLIGEEISSGALANERELVEIDRLYGTVRFVLRYGHVLAVIVTLTVLGLVWRIARRLFRRRMALT